MSPLRIEKGEGLMTWDASCSEGIPTQTRQDQNLEAWWEHGHRGHMDSEPFVAIIQMGTHFSKALLPGWNPEQIDQGVHVTFAKSMGRQGIEESQKVLEEGNVSQEAGNHLATCEIQCDRQG